MRIEKFDKNFKAINVDANDVYFVNANDISEAIYGIYYSNEEKCYRRLPKHVADNVNDGVKNLAYHTSGGRIKIKTNSPYLVIRAFAKPNGIMTNMPISAQWGFAIKEGLLYHGEISPTDVDITSQQTEQNVIFQGMRYIGNGEHDLTIFTPLYNGVNEIFIGVKKGCYLEKGSEYKYAKPIVFYGSSITQGGCASNSASSYINMLSESLSSDILNLGFSGSAKAEKVICDYVASLDPSIFVIDYDHNAPTVEHLINTHYLLYKTIREKHKNTPIVLLTRPNADRDCITVDGVLREPVIGFSKGGNAYANKRIEIVKATYEKAICSGDKNVYYICGADFFPNELRAYCTVDTCHPNNLGFYFMAKRLEPLLKELLEK